MSAPELWRPVDGWAGWYEVSDRGRVRSVARVVVTAAGNRRHVPGRLLKLCGSRDRTNEGPKHCTLAKGDVKVTFYPKATGPQRKGKQHD